MKTQILLTVIILIQAASIFPNMESMGEIRMAGKDAQFASDLYSIFRSDGFNSLQNNQFY